MSKSIRNLPWGERDFFSKKRIFRGGLINSLMKKRTYFPAGAQHSRSLSFYFLSQEYRHRRPASLWISQTAYFLFHAPSKSFFDFLQISKKTESTQ